MGNIRVLGEDWFMRDRIVAPYGAWKSPITPEMITAETVTLGTPVIIDEEDVYWVESRTAEAGRCAIMKRSTIGQITDITPTGFNVRTTVHEYGGGAYAVASGIVYFSNFKDQRVYKQEPGSNPVPITPEAQYRYADFAVDRHRGSLVCVREDHTGPGEAVNTLVSLHPDRPDGGQVLAAGNDFYSSPRIGPKGKTLAWLSWNHPNMPWDGTELWMGELKENGTLGHVERVAGGVGESVFQPEWSPDGVLYFVSDRTGWWNIYRLRDAPSPSVDQVCAMAAEFGVPQWVFGRSMYGFESAAYIICTYIQHGISQLARLNAVTGELETIQTPYWGIRNLAVSHRHATFVAESPTEPTAIVQLNLDGGRLEVLHRPSNTSVDSDYISVPMQIEFPTENGLTAYGLFYPPKNEDYTASDGKPLLLVHSHGGPTSAASTDFNLERIQYWTSRGFAVLDVNYGGSTGYGRAYRERLKGQWGVVDVDDCVNGALHLVRQGEVDGNRLIIRGGSAGGYTTLSALAFRNVFKAGASYYGVSDLEAMDRDTHKFESRYNLSLIGPYPKRRDLYRERSPIYSVDRFSCPIIFFQGLEDKVVPPDQSERMFEALRAKGLPTACVTFEGEQHGFRKGETIKRALQAELYFYSKVFKFQLAEHVERVHIENL
jgi:dipeptidyl aminopeptidase/acylaminoacyl peptidase